MSVIVKGMEMPPVCVTDDGWYGNCPIDRIWCAMRFKPEHEKGQRIIDEITGKRPAWCPLRPLPEKHGRLIDADTAYDRIMEQEGGNLVDMDCVGMGLEECETIAEAEGGDD